MNRTVQEFIIEGINKCKVDQFKEGILLFDQALSQQPTHEEALYNRAKAHFRIKNFDLSIKDFTTLLAHHPNNAFYFSERGVAYHLGGDSNKALDDLNKAAELEPNKPFRYSSRAFIKDRMGDLEGAIADYEKTIALDPEDAIAYNNKGLVEEKLGYQEKSKKSFEKADALDPKKLDVNKNEPFSIQDRKTTDSTATITEKKEPVAVTPIEAGDQKEGKNSIGMKGYLRQVKAIIGDKNERSAFSEFIKQFFSRKN